MSVAQQKAISNTTTIHGETTLGLAKVKNIDNDTISVVQKFSAFCNRSSLIRRSSFDCISIQSMNVKREYKSCRFEIRINHCLRTNITHNNTKSSLRLLPYSVAFLCVSLSFSKNQNRHNQFTVNFYKFSRCTRIHLISFYLSFVHIISFVI